MDQGSFKKHPQTVMHSNFTPKQNKGLLKETIKSLEENAKSKKLVLKKTETKV